MKFCWFQHDGVPAHYGMQVGIFLNKNFPDRSPMFSRLPNLNPLDFFLEVSEKKNIYHEPVRNLGNMVARVQCSRCSAVALIDDEDAPKNARAFMLHRENFCLEVRGKKHNL